MRYNFTRSPFCVIGIVWVDKGKNVKVTRIFLSEKGVNARRRVIRAFPKTSKKHNRKIDSILEKLKRSLEGKAVHFSSSYLNKYSCSKFQWSVILATKKIPRGKVISYKGLTNLAGLKNAARAVGNVMAKNPFPLIIPCHRVVNADGRMGEFQSGRSLKKKLLMSEGIKFDKKGRIPHEFFIGGRRC